MQSSLIKNSFPRFSGLTIGKVFCVYPEANMVDILKFDGTMLLGVQVTSTSSSMTGTANLPLSVYKQDMVKKRDPFSPAEITESDVFAVVGFIGGSILRPIVLGFLFPEENELLCARTDANNPDTTTKGNDKGGMLLWKHCSNVYTRVGEDGEVEISHPSGLLIKIGAYDAAKDPDEQRTQINNYDKKLRPFKYFDPETGIAAIATDMYIYHPSGTYTRIKADGTVEIYVEGSPGTTCVTKTIKGDLVETIEGNVTRTVKGDISELFEGKFDKTVKEDSTETVEGKCTEHVIGDVELTFDADLDSSVGGDETRDVAGEETDHIVGAWLRKSDTSIKDEAPIINHN